MKGYSGISAGTAKNERSYLSRRSDQNPPHVTLKNDQDHLSRLATKDCGAINCTYIVTMSIAVPPKYLATNRTRLQSAAQQSQ